MLEETHPDYSLLSSFTGIRIFLPDSLELAFSSRKLLDVRYRTDKCLGSYSIGRIVPNRP